MPQTSAELNKAHGDAAEFIAPWLGDHVNRRDPDPFAALFLDQSAPLDEGAKAALLNGLRSPMRQFILPIVRPLARMTIVLNQILKVFIPNLFTSSKILHLTIYWGLRFFVSPEANWLILRHFILGSEVLKFIRDNTPGANFPMQPLRPKGLAAVKDDLFLVHDLNLFNFVIDLNRHLRATGQDIGPPAKVDFSAITDGPLDIERMPRGIFNVIDLETAIEIYTPMYQILLTDSDFWRATNSLQLDETIGVYCAKILGAESRMWAVNNKHPLVPLTTLRAGNRLMLHGLSTEQLHWMLRMMKRRAAQ